MKHGNMEVATQQRRSKEIAEIQHISLRVYKEWMIFMFRRKTWTGISAWVCCDSEGTDILPKHSGT